MNLGFLSDSFSIDLAFIQIELLAGHFLLKLCMACYVQAKAKPPLAFAQPGWTLRGHYIYFRFVVSSQVGF